jgi:general secretion pathway protein G
MKKTEIKGFTLVEMLVVIAIIGILMALLFPAFTTVMKKAKITKSKAEISQIELAWKQYLIDYKQFPDTMEGESLMDENAIEILAGNNRRQTTYMELDPDEPYQDPWQNTYNVSLSTSIPQDAYYGADVYKQVLVWSYGPDETENTKDDIKNWK